MAWVAHLAAALKIALVLAVDRGAGMGALCLVLPVLLVCLNVGLAAAWDIRRAAHRALTVRCAAHRALVARRVVPVTLVVCQIVVPAHFAADRYVYLAMSKSSNDAGCAARMARSHGVSIVARLAVAAQLAVERAVAAEFAVLWAAHAARHGLAVALVVAQPAVVQAAAAIIAPVVMAVRYAALAAQDAVTDSS